VEKLRSYEHLVRFCRQAGLLTAGEAGRLCGLPASAQERGLRAATELRELLARIFYRAVEGRSPRPDDVAVVEEWAAACARHRELRWKDGQMRWAWKGLDENADAPALLLAQQALDLLMSGENERLHRCASGTCRWLFLDTSKNGTRRWCDMKTCGNRAKARRFAESHRVS
jgi:predicted RNA-binding Zn ribbon-like protein